MTVDRFRSISRATLRHVARTLLAVVGIALVVLTAVLVAKQWKSGGQPPRLLGERVAIADARSVGPETTCPAKWTDGPNRPQAELSLFIRSVDVHALTASVEAAICFPEALFLTLYTRKYGPTLHKTKEGGITFDPRRRFANASVDVDLTREIPSAGRSDEVPRSSSLRKEVPLGQLVGDEFPQINLGRITLPLIAATREYPFDWYSLRDEFSVLIWYLLGENNEEIKVQATGTNEPIVHVKVFADPALAPLVLSASESKPPRELDHGTAVSLRLTRSAPTRWYVVVIAGIPALLALLLCVVFLRPGIGDRPRVGPEAVGAVAAVLLAVLPIRLVLVPSSATELTLVDYWLGFEMAVLAAVACFAVRRTL